MQNIELENIWRSHDQKIEDMLSLNKEMAASLSRQKLDKEITRLYRPKGFAMVVGAPYTLILLAITMGALASEAYFVALGFGVIFLIMAVILGNYFYQMQLISKIRNSEGILSTQESLSKLRISSFNSLRTCIIQLPFWSICWVSIDALKASPFMYGGINLLVFLVLSLIAFWLYREVSYKNEKSKIRDFFLSGSEWEPIEKSAEILKQIKEYEK